MPNNLYRSFGKGFFLVLIWVACCFGDAVCYGQPAGADRDQRIAEEANRIVSAILRDPSPQSHDEFIRFLDQEACDSELLLPFLKSVFLADPQGLAAAMKRSGQKGAAGVGLAALRDLEGLPIPPEMTEDMVQDEARSAYGPGRSLMATGLLMVNGRGYKFHSGGFGNGFLPPGVYSVLGLEPTRQRGMVSNRGFSDEIGFKAEISDVYDSRVQSMRRNLSIHPDEGENGTPGTIGIVGLPDVQRDFYNDLAAEITRNNGCFTVQIGFPLQN